jgi:hypothetical protein
VTHIGGQSTGVTGKNRPRKRQPRYWFYSRARFLVRRHGAAAAHLANLAWLAGYPLGQLLAVARGAHRDRLPRFWSEFLGHYYGPGGIMYRTGEMKR